MSKQKSIEPDMDAIKSKILFNREMERPYFEGLTKEEIKLAIKDAKRARGIIDEDFFKVGGTE